MAIHKVRCVFFSTRLCVLGQWKSVSVFSSKGPKKSPTVHPIQSSTLGRACQLELPISYVSHILFTMKLNIPIFTVSRCLQDPSKL